MDAYKLQGQKNLLLCRVICRLFTQIMYKHHVWIMIFRRLDWMTFELNNHTIQMNNFQTHSKVFRFYEIHDMTDF